MIKNKPLIHASLAGLYIGLIVFVISHIVDREPETMLVPTAMLALLTLSVAVMSYLFFAEPVMLFMEGKKQEAVNFFLKTLGYFACLVALFLAIVVYTLR